MRQFGLQFSRFTLVGAVNFVFTFVLFYLSVKVMGVNHLFALVGVSLLGMLLTYCLNHIWVFQLDEKLAFRSRLPKYLSAGFLSIALNVLALHWLVESTDGDPFLLQLGLIPFIVVFNFSTAKFWSLRERTKDG